MDRDLLAVAPRRVQQQENADRQSIMVEHIAEAGIALGDLTLRLAAQSLHPVVARPADESARQEIRDRIDIGLGNLTASDGRPGHRRCSVACACRYRPSISRTPAGHLARSMPWVWNIATARRSIPNATQPVWAGSPAASLMSQVVPQWSR